MQEIVLLLEGSARHAGHGPSKSDVQQRAGDESDAGAIVFSRELLGGDFGVQCLEEGLVGGA